MPGYLGNNTLSDFIRLAESDSRMPCHSLVDYEAKDWKDKQETSPQCAGRGIYLGNRMKMPRDKSVLRLPANRDLIFSTASEFMEHHDDDSFDEDDA
jgi:hypothetical protein